MPYISVKVQPLCIDLVQSAPQHVSTQAPEWQHVTQQVAEVIPEKSPSCGPWQS